MAKKVLVFANDLVPEGGLPTSGGGLRAWGIYRGLLSRGFDVVCSVPAPATGSYLSRAAWDRVPPAMRETAWTWETQGQVIEAVAPDVVVYSSNPNHLTFLKDCPVPTALDLNGPFMLEGHYLREQSTPRDWEFCYRQLAAGDFYFAAGHKHKRFLWSWLCGAGVDITDSQLAVIPVSLSPDLPEGRRDAAAGPTFVFGGGFYPWTDPSRALLTLVAALERRKKGRLLAFTENHNTASTEDRFRAVRACLARSERVVLSGLRPYDELLQTYTTADVALDLMSWNPERELAITTRTIQYLWCGLPVIYNNYAELASYIKRYDAGWCLDPDDPRALEDVLDFILSHPESLADYSRNARRLAREHFTWERAVEPLARFCDRPRRRVVPPPPAERLDVDLSKNEFPTPKVYRRRALTQAFLARYNGLSRVELLLATHGGLTRGEVTFEVVHARSGAVVGSLTAPAERLEDNRWLSVPLTAPLANSAGETFLVRVSAPANEAGDAISVWATSYHRFPMAGLKWGLALQHGSLCLRTYCREGAAGARALPEPSAQRRLWQGLRRARGRMIAAARLALTAPLVRSLMAFLSSTPK